MIAIAILIISYIFGSIPVGLLFAKVKGIDIRKAGSGNIGTTNVLRSVGAKEALLTLIGDTMKGVFAVALMKFAGQDDPLPTLAGLFAVIGHDFSIFLKFNGGKGVATSIGAILTYSPYTGLATIFIWLIVVFFSRYSSLGALTSFLLLPIHILVFKEDFSVFFFSILFTLLIYYKHRDNIKRLLEGKELKIGMK